MRYVLVLCALTACGEHAPPSEQPDAGATTCGNGILDEGELCDGGAAVACSSLTPVWGAGQATCRTDCSGYDVTSCAPSSQHTDTVYPANRDARWTDARCNDQSPFAFQVQMAPTPTHKWVIYFEGGGSCDGTFDTCRGRSGLLVSTHGYEADHSSTWATSIGVILSRDPDINPELYDANMVFGLYCSSDGWSGTNATPQPITTRTGTAQWVFTGRRNARALADQLFRNFGLDDATSQLLVTGNSAGGVGAFVNIDLFATRMPRAIADRRISLLPSAAWTDTEFDDPHFPYAGSALPPDEIHHQVETIYGFDADPKCLARVAAAGKPASYCVGSTYNYHAAADPAPAGWGIRTLIAKNREDAASLNSYGVPPADSTEPDAIQARADYLQQITDEFADVAWLYAPDDPQRSASDDNLHGMISDPLVWSYQPPTGVSLQQLTSAFLRDEPPIRVEFTGDVPHTESPQ